MGMNNDVGTDPVIQALISEAATDPDVISLVLTGSRAIGATGPDSDYDVVFLMTDEAFARNPRPQITPARGRTVTPPISTKDIWNEAPHTMQLEVVEPWVIPTWTEARILYDRTGETERVLAPFRLMSVERAQHAVANWYDDYLNGFFRSLKCWRRGNELGGRLEAAQSVDPLLNMLFALFQRWRPYSSRLIFHLHHLARQGWQPGELDASLLDLISTGHPTHQQQLAGQVVTLLRERGFDHVRAAWEGQIEQAMTWHFP